MPFYRYTAKCLDGAVVRGRLEAADQTELATALRVSGQFLTKCKEVSDNQMEIYRPKAKELADFCGELGTMLSSGITLIRALDIILQNDNKPKLQALYRRLYTALQQGQSFSEALSAQHGVFPPLMINIFRSGEASGTMDSAAKKASVHFEKEHKINSKLKNAMIYPFILLVVAVLVMLAIFLFILPGFFKNFEDMGIELPGITMFVMSISDLLTQHWLECLLVVVGIAVVISTLIRLPQVQLFTDRLKLRLPKVGKLLQVVYTARFARTLSTLYTSGLSMLQALDVSANTVGNQYIASQFEKVVSDVRSGMALSQALRQVDGFSSKLISIVSIGEEAGRLDEMLERMADSFDFESEKAIDRLMAMLEPAMIVLLAVGVGLIMISVMLPLYTMYQNIG